MPRLSRLLPMTLAVAAAAAAAIAQTVRPDGPAVPIVASPVWVRTPNLADLDRVYPIAARQLGLAGGATLTCRVDAEGRLNTCTTANELPAKSGFGQAALALAPSFRMTDIDQEGVATYGGQVAIPIRFVSRTQTGSRLRSVGF